MIPDHTYAVLQNYIHRRVPPSQFIRSVLENDLQAAVLAANPHERLALADTAEFLYKHAPSACWGSKEAVRKWLAYKPRQLEVEAKGYGEVIKNDTANESS